MASVYASVSDDGGNDMNVWRGSCVLDVKVNP
jgi:hypothetical protein